MKLLETERLILRTWKTEDQDAYFNINQDPKVVEYLCGSLTLQEVEEFILAMNSQQDKYGYTLWATELKETGKLLGFIGLNYTAWEAHFTPAVEIGWRLGSQYWGKGYATEGAKAVRDYGFNTIGLKEIVSLTVPANKRSQRVMEKIGMKRDIEGNFFHAKIARDHPLSEHMLYRINKENVPS